MACAALFPYFGNPRIAAGGPLSNDVLECALKPLAQEDYVALPVPFTDAQWARLESAFPDGVCDWDAPAPGAAPTVPWLSFANGPGGEPLGSPPVSLPELGRTLMLGVGMLLTECLRRLRRNRAR